MLITMPTKQLLLLQLVIDDYFYMIRLYHVTSPHFITLLYVPGAIEALVPSRCWCAHLPQ